MILLFRRFNLPTPGRVTQILGNRIRRISFTEKCVEINETEEMFTGEVKDRRTREYVEGRFG